MKKWKKILNYSIAGAILLCSLSLIGCSILDRLTEPNNVTPITQGLNVAGTVTTAIGMPWGWMLTTAAGIIGTVAAAYTSYRNKIKAADKYSAIEATTGAIVNAIETVSKIPIADKGTIGDIVKDEVKKKLQGQQIYEVGKAIITGLKD